MKQHYQIDHLDCANCAAKIEAKIKQSPNVSDAALNFISRKLTVEYTSSSQEDDAVRLTHLQKIAASIEHGVVVRPWDNTSEPMEHASSHTEDSCCSGACGPNHSHEHSGSHGHNHSHGEKAGKNEVLKNILYLVSGTAISFVGIALLDKSPFFLALIILGYLILGHQVLITSFRNILHGQIFDENFLVAIATVGAFIIGEYPEAVAVMLLYQIGEFLQNLAVDKSRKHLTDAMNLKAPYANLKTPEGLKAVAPETVNTGDILIIKPSEKIPLDGVVTEGSSFVDTSSLTGESVPRQISEGNEILSGCINGSGTLTIRVTRPYSDSTVARVLDLVENATARKAPTENFITKFAKIYTPIVVIAAVLLAVLPPVISGSFDFVPWIYKACGFLVVSCPCALVISVPLGFFGGIGCASKNGIIVKGSNYLEALNHVTTAVFDKTGTLTKGTFQVTGIAAEEGYTKEEILKTAALAESLSNHPIAKSITGACSEPIDTSLVSNYEEIAGHGIKAVVEGRSVLLGSRRLLEEQKVLNMAGIKEAEGTVTHLAVNGEYAGTIVISDEIKKDSIQAMEEFKALGIRTVMLTGDTAKTASRTAQRIGIDTVWSQLLPGDKVDKIEALLHEAGPKDKVLFTGDGINDAPVLARADIGIAMGGVGSDAAIEAADIVLMTDEPSKIPAAIRIAHFTRRIVTENIILALTVKAAVMILLAVGLGSMWLAVFADVGVALIAIFNSIRALNAHTK